MLESWIKSARENRSAVLMAGLAGMIFFFFWGETFSLVDWRYIGDLMDHRGRISPSDRFWGAWARLIACLVAGFTCGGLARLSFLVQGR